MTQSQLPQIVVMASGSGTNLQAIMDAITKDRIRGEIALVVSNHNNAYALERAEKAGIPTLYFPLKPYKVSGKARELYDADLAAQIQPYQPDLIVLAGWMHILSDSFLKHFPRRVINLHPALPGAFAGKDAIARTFDAYHRGATNEGGCMMHFVIPEVDAGPVILEARVAIESAENLAEYEQMIHAAEHQVIVQAVALVLEGQA